jgi:hypothetical protein
VGGGDVVSALHTPGPLVYESHPNEANRGVIGVPGGRWVASILHNGEALPVRQHADGLLWANAANLFDKLETLVDAITTGAGRDFIEAFVRDASAALEEAQPGWNKVDEPTASEMRARARVRDAAPDVLASLVAMLEAMDDGSDEPTLVAARAARAKATGASHG